MGRSVIAICLAVAITGVGSAGASAAGAHVDVPIGQLTLPNGDVRYDVPVTIGGGAPIVAELDTGSFGLRVLAAAVKPDQYEATDIRRRFPFGGGARFSGMLARAAIGVGSSQTDGPILFQVVQHVDCVEKQPHCAVSRIKPEDYRIAGDGYPGHGFLAILGISMRKAQTSSSADNPLAAMGDGSWIVVLPRPGSAVPGHLIINPTAEDRAGFATLQLQPLKGGGEEDAGSGQEKGWADGALSGCLIEESSNERHCGKTLLDSGAPGFSVDSMSAKGPAAWKAGTRAKFELVGADAPVEVPFTTGPDWSNRVFVHPPRQSGVVRLSAGTLPFFSYAVLYDAKAGTIGFKQRDSNEP